MDTQRERPQTARVLERWRQQARLSKQRLADLADVSATYVRTIEAGFDDQGRVVVPSAAIMQKLAHGLALAETDETRRPESERLAYAELMAAAGYLHPGLDDPAPPASPPDGGLAAPSRPSRIPPAGASYQRVQAVGEPLRDEARQYLAHSDASRSVTLRDARLWRHARAILEGWESLSADDQALLLGIFEFVHGRQSRGAIDLEEDHDA